MLCLYTLDIYYFCGHCEFKPSWGWIPFWPYVGRSGSNQRIVAGLPGHSQDSSCHLFYVMCENQIWLCIVLRNKHGFSLEANHLFLPQLGYRAVQWPRKLSPMYWMQVQISSVHVGVFCSGRWLRSISSLQMVACYMYFRAVCSLCLISLWPPSYIF